MAQINEYMPETEAAGPVGSAPAPVMAGAVGQAVERMGAQAMEGADYLGQRLTQSETSDAYAAAAQARSDFMAQVQDETDRGVIDSSKIKEKYQAWMNQQADNYSTPGGKNAFNRFASRTYSSVMRAAARGQVQVAGNNALADFQKAGNQNAAFLEKNPEEFQNVRDSTVELAGMNVDNGVWSPSQARKVQTFADAETAKAALMGWANKDYDSAKNAVLQKGGANIDPEDPRFNTAKAMLDKGAFDQFLTEDQRRAVRSEIEARKHGGLLEGTRILAANEQRRQDIARNWMNQNSQSIFDGSMPMSQVMDPKKTPQLYTLEQRMYVANAIAHFANRENKTDPALYNSIVQRIYDEKRTDHIDSPLQIAQLAANGSLAGKDAETLTTMLDKSPQGEENRANQKMLVEAARGALVHENKLAGLADPDGELNLMRYTNDLQGAIRDAVTQNKPISSVLSPNSPDFFGKRLAQYRVSPQDIIKKQADQIRASAGVQLAGTKGPDNQSAPVVGLPPKAPVSKIPALPFGPGPGTQSDKPSVFAAEMNPPAAPMGPAGGPAGPEKPKKATPPPGLTLEEFKAWRREHGG